MEKFEDKISNYKSLLKDIPIGLHILDQDNKKFNLNFKDYGSIPEMISNKENREEIIDYFTNKINFILEKRKLLEWRYDKSLSEKEKEKVGIEIKELEEAKKDGRNFLGIGKVGAVYETKYDSTVCLKYLNVEVDPNTNNLQKEFFKHKRVSDLFAEEKNLHSFRVPVVIHLVENTQNKAKTFFSMEKVEGFTFRDINNNPNKLLELFNNDKSEIEKLIKKLNDEKYLNGFKEDIELMHNKTGIIHGDVHLGNIMISKEMSVYLIDFGNSVDTNMVNITESEQEKVDNIKDQDISAVLNSLNILKKSAEDIIDKI